MSGGFYNYDTRGASEATQIVNLERMVEDRDAEIERLRNALAMARDAEIERLREAVLEEREACAKVCDQRAKDYGYETDFYAHEHVSEALYCAEAIRARSKL